MSSALEHVLMFWSDYPRKTFFGSNTTQNGSFRHQNLKPLWFKPKTGFLMSLLTIICQRFLSPSDSRILWAFFRTGNFKLFGFYGFFRQLLQKCASSARYLHDLKVLFFQFSPKSSAVFLHSWNRIHIWIKVHLEKAINSVACQGISVYYAFLARKTKNVS